MEMPAIQGRVAFDGIERQYNFRRSQNDIRGLKRIAKNAARQLRSGQPGAKIGIETRNAASRKKGSATRLRAAIKRLRPFRVIDSVIDER